MNHHELMQGRIEKLERKLASAQKDRDHYAGLYADRCGQLLECEALDPAISDDAKALVDAERERCAQIADEYRAKHDLSWAEAMDRTHTSQVRFEGHAYAGKNIADRIRGVAK